MSEKYRNALPQGTIVDTYQIEEVLGVGGFGVAYLAYELNLNKTYAIKELMPDGIAVRQVGDTKVLARSHNDEDDFDNTRKYFIREAKVLASINHPAVVGVHRLFEANGTCYMVMDYVEGCTLTEHLKQYGGKIRGLNEFESIFYPVMDGMSVLHAKGLVHRDIKPGNIMVTPEGLPILLDFGAVCSAQSKTVTVTQMLSAGYSPFEQYTSKAKQGPYTDIYSLGATMARCITGQKPDDASDRMYEDGYKPLAENNDYLEVYGKIILKAVDQALLMDAKKRPQTVRDWREMMEQPSVEPEGQPLYEVYNESTDQSSSGRKSGNKKNISKKVKKSRGVTSGKKKISSFPVLKLALFLVIAGLGIWGYFESKPGGVIDWASDQIDQEFKSRERKQAKEDKERQEQEKQEAEMQARIKRVDKMVVDIKQAIDQEALTEAAVKLEEFKKYRNLPGRRNQWNDLTDELNKKRLKFQQEQVRSARVNKLKSQIENLMKAKKWGAAEEGLEELKEVCAGDKAEYYAVSKLFVIAKMQSLSDDEEKEKKDAIMRDLLGRAEAVLVGIEERTRKGK